MIKRMTHPQGLEFLEDAWRNRLGSGHKVALQDYSPEFDTTSSVASAASEPALAPLIHPLQEVD
jgi:hypothetical protein